MKNKILKKNIVFAILLFSSLFVMGCVSNNSTEKETTLTSVEDLGVIYFGAPAIGGQEATFAVQKVRPENNAYLSVVIRNNALGDEASNIELSLDNVEPFKIVECGVAHEPNDIRDTSKDEFSCNTWAPDNGKQVRTHFLEHMFPNEEIEFIYILQAPSSSEIANVYYEHNIYYTLNYHYKVGAYEEIQAMTQEEFTRKSTNKENILGNAGITAGALRATPKQQTVIYSPGIKQNFLYEYTLTNAGKGIIKPNSYVNVSIQYPNAVEIPSYGEWIDISHCQINAESGEKGKWCAWYRKEYGIGEGEDIGNVIVASFPSIEFITEKPITMQFNLKESYTNMPLQSLKFYMRISYDYMQEGTTKIGVLPLK